MQKFFKNIIYVNNFFRYYYLIGLIGEILTGECAGYINGQIIKVDGVYCA